MYELVLASSSPRRRQILSQAGYQLRTSSVKVSEIPRKNLNLTGQIRDIAERKAQSLVESDKSLEKQGILVLSADTVVVLDGEILGKPTGPGQAEQFLARLSGRQHMVITGVCLWQTVPKRVVTFHECTVVRFKELSRGEVEEYLSTREWTDKAGGYGIQGHAGRFVDSVSGSYNNVVGLPVEKLERILDEHGWRICRTEAAGNS